MFDVSLKPPENADETPNLPVPLHASFLNNPSRDRYKKRDVSNKFS